MTLTVTPLPEKPAYPKAPKRDGLGPNQLRWLEEKFRFYGVFRAQAEAQTGVAVVMPEPPVRQ